MNSNYNYNNVLIYISNNINKINKIININKKNK